MLGTHIGRYIAKMAWELVQRPMAIAVFQRPYQRDRTFASQCKGHSRSQTYFCALMALCVHVEAVDQGSTFGTGKSIYYFSVHHDRLRLGYTLEDDVSGSSLDRRLLL